MRQPFAPRHRRQCRNTKFGKQGENLIKEFESKVALVTGGGSGIGRAAALAFAREGAQVVIGNRNVQRGEETVSMIRDVGGTASFRRTDVLVAADIEALVDHTISEYGGLDLAFNNAGIEGDVRTSSRARRP